VQLYYLIYFSLIGNIGFLTFQNEGKFTKATVNTFYFLGPV